MIISISRVWMLQQLINALERHKLLQNCFSFKFVSLQWTEQFNWTKTALRFHKKKKKKNAFIRQTTLGLTSPFYIYPVKELDKWESTTYIGFNSHITHFLPFGLFILFQNNFYSLFIYEFYTGTNFNSSLFTSCTLHNFNNFTLTRVHTCTHFYI